MHVLVTNHALALVARAPDSFGIACVGVKMIFIPPKKHQKNSTSSSHVDLGLSCRLRGDVRQTPIAKLYCMACDPDQPKVSGVAFSFFLLPLISIQYVRPEPFVPIINSGNVVTTSKLTLGQICPDNKTFTAFRAMSVILSSHFNCLPTFHFCIQNSGRC
jgi:hypothetical protein